MKCDEDGIRRAVDAVRSGGVIVFPTDTVYGMGCDPYDAKAVGEIFRIKGRDPEKPLPLLAHSIGDLEGVAALEGYGGMTSRFWPGPLTIVAELRDGRLRKTMGLGESIAVRVPDGGCVRGILDGCRLLVGTSANPSGAGPFTDPDECLASVGDVPVFVDGGTIPGAGESTIVGLLGGKARILREGRIPGYEVLRAL